MCRSLYPVALFALTVALPVSASIEISVYDDVAGDVKCISAPVIGEIEEAHVVVTGATSLTSVSFRTITPALLFLEDVAVFSQTTGTSVAGATVIFDNCLSSPIHVLTIRYIPVPWDYASQGCPFLVVDETSGMDCGGQVVPIIGGATRIVPGPCEINGPSDPSPPDQAQGVPLDVVLEWAAEPAPACVLGEILYFTLYFGVSPDPPLLLQRNAWPPQDPGDLQPGTQYYWRVMAVQDGYNTQLSPLWTFRTAQPVASEATTWGRIKALYRD